MVDSEEVEKKDDSKVEDAENMNKVEKLEVEEKVAEALEDNSRKLKKFKNLNNLPQKKVQLEPSLLQQKPMDYDEVGPTSKCF